MRSGYFDPLRFIVAYKPNYNLITTKTLILFKCPHLKLIKIFVSPLNREMNTQHSGYSSKINKIVKFNLFTSSFNNKDNFK